MGSDNPTGADNQQERPGIEQWVVGFVDGVVVPFFEQHPLITAKQADFVAFASVLRMMENGAHLTEVGLRRIAAVTEQMNRRGRSRFLESSEAIRRPARTDVELKIWS
jgi:hypothetical protein